MPRRLNSSTVVAALLAAMTATITTTTCAAEPAPSIAPIKINGVVISAEQIERLHADLERRGSKTTLDVARDRLITLEVLAQEALKNKLDQRPEVQRLLDMQRRNLLAEAVLETARQPVAEAEISAAYNQLKAQAEAAKPQEYKAAHILVDNETTAKKILKQLAQKKSFASLAKRYSKDPGSAKNGGDLGWVHGENLVPEFTAALEKLKPGQRTEQAVKTRFGWHIIQLESRRTVPFPSLEEARSELQSQIEQLKLRRWISQLRAQAKIE